MLNRERYVREMCVTVCALSRTFALTHKHTSTLLSALLAVVRVRKLDGTPFRRSSINRYRLWPAVLNADT